LETFQRDFHQANLGLGEEALVLHQMDDPVPLGAGINAKESMGAAYANFGLPW
jgi:hypothetical protein